MREITWFAALGALLVSILVSFSYPYIVLKLGEGPNVSLLSAFLGAAFLFIVARRTHGQNRLMNNVIQTAGTSASMTAFMCVIAAGFDYLARDQRVNVSISITPIQMFIWLSLAGGIGVLFVPIFRKYFLDDPRMIFPDGVSAAETVKTLDSEPREARGKLSTLGASGLVGGVFGFLNDGLNAIPAWYWNRGLMIGTDWNLLSLGTGMIIPLSVALSGLAATLCVWIFGPLVIQNTGLQIVQNSIASEFVQPCLALIGVSELTTQQQTLLNTNCGTLPDYLSGNYFGLLLQWTMWPATGMLIASAFTAVILQWRSIVRLFRTLGRTRTSAEDIPPSVTIAGVAIFGVLLAIFQNTNFGLSYIETLLAIAISLPLMLIGIHVLGETDNGPVSVTANSLQIVFGLIFPAQIAHNMIAAGIAGNTNAQAEGTMQDFKTGQILGSTPRVLTWVQLAAVPVGAAGVAIMYPLLVAKYGIGPNGLVAPTGLKFANMAVLMSEGLSAFPAGALPATAIAVVLGILITVAALRWNLPWLPSPAGFGFGLILPGTLNVMIGAGGILGWLWKRRFLSQYENYRFTVAAGLISGEAIISGLLLPFLSLFGVL
ncbi:MAG: peptide transporter [Dehalococcoidia bacterium]|nr:MAG: peptide transporter [Dehalococcoidia bacterium]